MTKRLIDVDDELVAAVREALGTTSLDETVHMALTETLRARRRQALTREDLREFGRLARDLGDPEVMRQAWE